MPYLIPALGISPGDVVALVGAGGKTSLMFALALEAADRWGPARVLVTTTTRIQAPSPGDLPPLVRSDLPFLAGGDLPLAGPAGSTPEVVLAGSLAEALAVIARHGERRGAGPVTLAARLLPDDRPKLAGVPPDWVDEIARRFPSLLVLVEADGSARRPLKAPLDHEPVVPPSSRVVLAVAGADAVGLPLASDHVHRPERVARLAGLRPGEAITPETVARVLGHPEGCGKGRPPGSRLVPVVNKVDTPHHLAQARQVATELVSRGSTLVMLTCCLRWPVLVEVVAR